MPNPETLRELLQIAPGDAVAVVAPETGLTLTYDDLRREAQAAAAVFASAGIKPGDRVAIALPNGIPVLVCFLAASFAGTAAPLNLAYRQDEFTFYLDDTNAKLLLVPPEGGEAAVAAANAAGIPVFVVNTVEGRVIFTDGKTGATPPASAPSPVPTPDQIALILHTSGSTGRPKRVPIPHRNLAVSAGNIAAHYQLTPNDVSLCVMPLFHVHGLVASVLATLYSGGRIIVPGKFNALSFWRTVRDHHVTWYSAVPTIHQVLLARAGGERPQGAESLRFIRSCSAALSPEHMQQMEQVFGAPVLEAYGMTEASHQMASNPLPPKERKPGSVGIATGIDVGIMDAEGNLQPAGTPGEVVIRGASVVKGYENNPEANASSFTNGWFRTGDQGVIDEAGYLRLIGRLKEMINRGGEKISPRELDEVLASHPAVAEAVCFGVPHPSWGEEVAAAVTLKPDMTATEAELLAFCRERLADFKRPKKIHIVEQIPRTATGKIQRRAVAAVFA
ncbi:MAG TPA: acyl--CoA ligase [Bryobacteraceae bacterium]|nr:acyl--CoA ligase [Bryobacteraceae bacterium]